MNEVRRDPVRVGAAELPRILVVEDEADLALLLTYNLEAEGYSAESVERGDEAELRLVETPPDLVILDWMLPGVSGLEICRRLRAREATRTLPVIMLTARGEEVERVRGLSVGADDYVVKPFSVPELMARVRALLRRSRPERIAERLTAGASTSIGKPNGCAAARATFISARRNFDCSNICSRGPAAFFRARSCSTAYGVNRSKSTSAPSTFMSDVCAKHCRAAASETRSARCAAPAIRSTKRSAEHSFYEGNQADFSDLIGRSNGYPKRATASTRSDPNGWRTPLAMQYVELKRLRRRNNFVTDSQ